MKRFHILASLLFLLPTIAEASDASIKERNYIPRQITDNITVPDSPETITLPLPAGESITFALIQVSDQSNIFTSIAFPMGNLKEKDYRYSQIKATISGTIYVKGKGNASGYWAIPIATTELTRGQYASIISPDNMPDPEEAKLPQTDISPHQIHSFIEKLNIWCLENEEAKRVLQSAGTEGQHGVPYVRLPLESEWEFAARGGLYVDATRFGNEIPYEDKNELKKSEVISNVYENEIKPVGSTNKTNPCGLYDMLGNVSEIVDGSFRPEYHHGRVGGILVRGGNIATKENDATSFFREEKPLYFRGKPFSGKRIGTRLALGSDILTRFLISNNKIDKEWANYYASNKTPNPGSTMTDSTEERLTPERKDLADLLSNISATLGDKKGSSIDMQQLNSQLEAVKNQVANMEKEVLESYVTTAQAGLQMLYYSSAGVAETVKKAKLMRLNADGASQKDIRDMWNNKAATLEKNLETYWESYVKGYHALSKVNREIIEGQAKLRRQEISQKGETTQLAIFNLSLKIYDEFLKKGRLSTEERKEWINRLSELK